MNFAKGFKLTAARIIEIYRKRRSTSVKVQADELHQSQLKNIPQLTEKESKDCDFCETLA